MSKDDFLVCSRRRFKPPDFTSWVTAQKGVKVAIWPLRAPHRAYIFFHSTRAFGKMALFTLLM